MLALIHQLAPLGFLLTASGVDSASILFGQCHSADVFLPPPTLRFRLLRGLKLRLALAGAPHLLDQRELGIGRVHEVAVGIFLQEAAERDRVAAAAELSPRIQVGLAGIEDEMSGERQRELWRLLAAAGPVHGDADPLEELG